MSEENSPSPEAPAASAEAAPRVRRISNPRPKKVAAAKRPKSAASAAVVEAPAAPEPVKTPERVRVAERVKAPEPVQAPELVEDLKPQQDWPEPETVSETPGTAGENKRKRRRRKGKGGQGNQNSNSQNGSSSQDDAFEPVPASSRPAQSIQTQSPPPSQSPLQHPPQSSSRNSVSPEILAKKAWKIFLAEVSEEGVALISDHDARELSRRCFRLAEIFMDEQGRKAR